jgi:hypothetical protein
MASSAGLGFSAPSKALNTMAFFVALASTDYNVK